MTTVDLIATLKDICFRADSDLSLLWHRYVPAERKGDPELAHDVERTIADLRRTYDGRDALLAQLEAILRKP